MVFRTSVKLTVLLFTLAAIFAGMGYWQLQRKAEKEAMFERFSQAPERDVAEVTLERDIYARAHARGRYDEARHILLDNRILNGRAGVHVLTPFTSEDGRVFLVNRGWLPLPPDRSSLPDVPTPAGPRAIAGRINRLVSDGPRLGEQAPLTSTDWPQLLTYIDREPIEKALGLTLQPWLLQLDADQDGGFAGREWKAAVMEPEVHGAYAVQWFGLMTAAIVIWLVLGIRNGGKSNGATRERENEV